MATQTLQQALEQLYGQERRRDKLGLDGTRALLAALGNPERRFRAVHVAGTNGKGSVCARIERALREAGHRTGLYTSPHLVDFRERIRVDGRWPDEGRLFDALRRIEALPGTSERTFFEVATALGFLDFAERGVEWAVVEVGLGGRLDTTNVLEPALAVITPIGLDHTEILGTTIEAIAAEKAGIVKSGIPVVLGAGMDPRAATVIRAIAGECGAPVIEAGGNVTGDDFAGDNQRTARTALAALVALGVRIPDQAIELGLANARWPGRLEPAPGEPRLWWDGAHNAHGLAALARSWQARGLGRPAAIVLATSRDKPIADLLAAIAPLAGGAIVIATRTRNPRAADPAEITTAALARGLETRAAPDLASAVRQGLERATPERPVLLTGSLFAVGEAMEEFGGAPGEYQ